MTGRGTAGKRCRLRARSPMSLLDALGTAGAAIIVLVYFANQRRWLASTDWRFPLANLVGASLILASLARTWNLPSAVMESFWVLISLYGIVQNLRTRGPRAGG
jgi:hypothetical protein